jgi:acyl-CoA synthetase (AMP-forming)/AMP-acid ligase II
MTEAAHQMTSNPLPPRERRAATVGLPAGPEVAIMNDEGMILPRGHVGEVVIRGANVTPGYENNPEANDSAFIDGWFRTGDQGLLERDGYLRLTGRIKELINRGGEKIAPIEIDVVLMDHPAVQQCVTFAVPHSKLGEDIAAAVVLREGMTCSERDLREFAARRLEHWKVPRKFLFVREIPKGRTGKLQRIGLAAKLGLAG